jgi:hypothetical protein
LFGCSEKREFFLFLIYFSCSISAAVTKRVVFRLICFGSDMFAFEAKIAGWKERGG